MSKDANKPLATSSESIQQPWYKSIYIWMIILIPTVAVVLSSFYTYLAYSGRDDVVRDDYYMDGKQVIQDMSRDSTAALAEMSAVVNLDATGKINLRLAGINQDKQPPFLFINFYHVAHENKDQKITLKNNADGVYIGQLKPENGQMISGIYNVEVDGTSWRLREQVKMPTHKISMKFDPTLILDSKSVDE